MESRIKQGYHHSKTLNEHMITHVHGTTAPNQTPKAKLDKITSPTVLAAVTSED